MSEVVAAQSFTVTRADLVRYAGASGDFNPIHYSDRIATSVGLPGVIAHGMFTMALGARVLTDWLGDPARLLNYSVRFTKPVVVPDDDAGATVDFEVSMSPADADGTAKVDLTARCGADKVLGRARATVRV